MDLSPSHLLDLYRRGELKPSDLIRRVLERLHHESQEGVWTFRADPEKVLAAAEALDRRLHQIDELPLFGLPFSVKDCIDVAGEPTSAACPEFTYTATASNPVVEAALAAGAIYIGKTNLDQFATGLVGVRSPYGIARNPHNPRYIPGGSSSGAAVSVATGTSSFALGTDTGGSGRVPASYCGVTGLKPAPGALSRRGMVSACRSFDTISIYTQTPADALLVLRQLAAFDREDPFSLRDYALEGSGRTVLRVATPRPDQLEFFGNPETERLFGQALEKAGRVFGPVAAIDFSPFLAVNPLMFKGPFVAERDVSVGEFLERHPGVGVEAVRNLILGSRQYSAADAYRALYQVQESKRRAEALWEQYDALLVPTVGTLFTVEQALADPYQPSFANGYYTNYANPLGLAAVAFPHAQTVDGVPYGVTLVGPARREPDLVRLATAFMEAN